MPEKPAVLAGAVPTGASEDGDAKTEGQTEDDEQEYPAAWRLGLITIALCLSVFCMALVR
jgi:hypothetical protein